MVTRDGTTDVTEAVASYSRLTIEGLRRTQLDGFILKKDSPSCGLERVRVHDQKGQVRREGRGLFAAALVEMMPNLPVEEEGRLSDPILREAFFERVFAMRRVNDLASKPRSASDLVFFHATSKLQLMAHSPSLTTALGRLVADAGRQPDRALARYRSGFIKALSVPTDRGRHVNVLQHGLGYFKRILGRTARRDLLDAIHGYAAREVPLVVPVSLLAHRARAENVEHLADQIYLDPYPAALGLRNAIDASTSQPRLDPSHVGRSTRLSSGRRGAEAASESGAGAEADVGHRYPDFTLDMQVGQRMLVSVFNLGPNPTGTPSGIQRRLFLIAGSALSNLLSTALRPCRKCVHPS